MDRMSYLEVEVGSEACQAEIGARETGELRYSDNRFVINSSSDSSRGLSAATIGYGQGRSGYLDLPVSKVSFQIRGIPIQHGP